MLTKIDVRNGQPCWIDDQDNPVDAIRSEDGGLEEVINETEFPGSEDRVTSAFFLETPEGREFTQRFNTPENQARFTAIFNRLFPDGRVSVSRWQKTFQTGASIGEFQEAPAVVSAREAAAAAKARDAASGQFIDERTRLLRERDVMLADPATPASAITARMRVDAKFRAAIESEHVAPAATSTELSREERADAERFAWAFIHAPKVEFLGGYASLKFEDGTTHRFKPDEWNAEFERAQAAGCLR